MKMKWLYIIPLLQYIVFVLALTSSPVISTPGSRNRIDRESYRDDGDIILISSLVAVIIFTAGPEIN